MSTASSVATSTKRTPTSAAACSLCPVCGDQHPAVFLSAPDRFHLRKEKYTLARCSSCLGVWLVNPPHPEEMVKHYTAEYHRAIAWAGETSVSRRWKAQRARIARYQVGGAILDIGCSSGGFLSTLDKNAWRQASEAVGQVLKARFAATPETETRWSTPT